ncbi:MAG: hypothetical protein ACE5GN_04980 [Waddliaceae bacterium]
MGKANYRKVEEAISKGMHDIKVGHLLEEAKAASTGKRVKKKKLSPKQMMTIIRQDLKWMKKSYPAKFKKLKIEKKLVDTLADKVAKSPDELSKKDLETIKKIKEEVTNYKKEKCAPKKNEDLIKSQRKGHIYKRHNVREKWVPLDTHSDLSEFET